MLAILVVEEIDRLLKEGRLSQRKIAARLGVSRGTVGAIASGRRAIFGREPESDETHSHAAFSPPTRCPRCGFLVCMPCLVCRARDYRQAERLLRRALAARRFPSVRVGRRVSIESGEAHRRDRVA